MLCLENLKLEVNMCLALWSCPGYHKTMYHFDQIIFNQVSIGCGKESKRCKYLCAMLMKVLSHGNSKCYIAGNWTWKYLSQKESRDGYVME